MSNVQEWHDPHFAAADLTKHAVEQHHELVQTVTVARVLLFPSLGGNINSWVWVKIRYPNNWMVNTKLDISICGPLGLPFWPTSTVAEKHCPFDDRDRFSHVLPSKSKPRNPLILEPPDINPLGPWPSLHQPGATDWWLKPSSKPPPGNSEDHPTWLQFFSFQKKIGCTIQNIPKPSKPANYGRPTPAKPLALLRCVPAFLVAAPCAAPGCCWASAPCGWLRKLSDLMVTGGEGNHWVLPRNVENL